MIGDGTLVLEVGGEQGSLRAALAAAGIPVAPPRRIVEPARAAPMPEPDAGGEAAPPSPEAPPTPPPAPAADAPAFVEVKLGRGQTLIHLAKRHLGDGNRFREILACNGWDEDDARRLREGQTVKVPSERAAAPARR